MTKFPFFVKTIHNIKRPVVPPPLPASPYEKVIDYENLKEGYRKATRGQRKYTREAVKYDLLREKNNVDLHLDTNKKTKVFYMRQGVNAYGFKIRATHMMLRTESKRREKRRIKAMVRKMREGKITRAAVVQAVNSWIGFARWASSYNLAKKIFAPYRFIKTEGEIPYGAISRNRQARRILQQRRNSQAAHKAVAA